MNKEKEVEKYSNPQKVHELAKMMKLNPVEISTKKDKKYMIYDNNGHVIHFGAMGYIDYTKSKDKTKLNHFMHRNHKWYNAPKYTPAYLSAYLLWNPHF